MRVAAHTTRRAGRSMTQPTRSRAWMPLVSKMPPPATAESKYHGGRDAGSASMRLDTCKISPRRPLAIHSLAKRISGQAVGEAGHAADAGLGHTGRRLPALGRGEGGGFSTSKWTPRPARASMASR